MMGVGGQWGQVLWASILGEYCGRGLWAGIVGVVGDLGQEKQKRLTSSSYVIDET